MLTEANGLIVNSSDTSRQLALLELAGQQLAQAKDIDSLLDLRDRAEAIRHYMAVHGEGIKSQNAAAELKLRAERRLGKLLAETVEHSGGKKAALSNSVLPKDVSRMQSSRWQQLAKIPTAAFEQHVSETLGAAKELTTAGALRLAKKGRQPVNQPERNEDGCTVTDLQSLVDAEKKFGCIYADPPWQYGNQATRASTDNHYATMPIDAIAALPVRELAADRSHIHLWTTNGFLRDALCLLDGWGFEFKASFIWCKPQIGLGNYWRNAHEFLLLGVRGSLTFAEDARDLPSWGRFDRLGHSTKPAEIRGMIERASPPPFLELFGRRRVKGWAVWGNEINGDEFRQETFA